MAATLAAAREHAWYACAHSRVRALLVAGKPHTLSRCNDTPMSNVSFSFITRQVAALNALASEYEYALDGLQWVRSEEREGRLAASASREEVEQVGMARVRPRGARRRPSPPPAGVFHT